MCIVCPWDLYPVHAGSLLDSHFEVPQPFHILLSRVHLFVVKEHSTREREGLLAIKQSPTHKLAI